MFVTQSVSHTAKLVARQTFNILVMKAVNSIARTLVRYTPKVVVEWLVTLVMVELTMRVYVILRHKYVVLRHKDFVVFIVRLLEKLFVV